MHARNAAALVLLAALAGCAGYGAPGEVVNGVTVLTQYQPTADFGSYTYYSVTPTVQVVDATGTVIKTYDVDASQIIPTIRQNMDARGYSYVAPTSTSPAPDLIIGLYATLGSQAVYYPGYCDWCYWGYCGYYCYPGYTYAGSYNYGTLIEEMGDFKNADPITGKLPLVWTSASYGILSSAIIPPGGGTVTNVNWPKLQASIDQAFQDSPYIVHP